MNYLPSSWGSAKLRDEPKSYGEHRGGNDKQMRERTCRIPRVCFCCGMLIFFFFEPLYRHYLLAAGGINTDEVLRDLDSIDFQNAYESSSSRVDTDLDVRSTSTHIRILLLTPGQTYLRNRKEQNVMSSIEDGMRRTGRDFDAFVAKNVTIEWEAQKQRIFEHFGLAPRSAAAAGSSPVDLRASGFGGGLSAFGASSFGRSRLNSSFGPGRGLQTSVWSKSTLGNSVLGRSTSAATSSGHQGTLFGDIDPGRQLELSRQVQVRQQRYALAIRHMNEVRLESGNAARGIFPVMKTFGDITSESGTDLVGSSNALSESLLLIC